LSAVADLPLTGLKVLDLTWVVVGPNAIRVLADFGATVIHVESGVRVDTARTVGPYKGGTPNPAMSVLSANVNANKLDVQLNLATEAGRDVVKRLVAWADVVTESFTPRAMKAWGLDYENLRAVNPGIILVSTCLNGQTGPIANFAGFGNLGAALAGFVDYWGWPDRDPAGPAGAYTDYVATRFITAAVLGALEHRRRTGEGQHVDVAQAEAAMHFLTPGILRYGINGKTIDRAGNSDPVMCPHGTYPCKGEDRWVAIACQSPAQWPRLAALIGEEARDPRFDTLLGRRRNVADLDAVIAAWTSGLEDREVERLCQEEGIAAHAVITSADALADPHLSGHFHTLPHSAMEEVVVEGPRIALSRTPPRVDHAGPALGEHNDYVLREVLSLDDEAITELVIAGALD
jgi:benzylsuccinate CoA-transferase BbsF subunit